MPTLDTTVVLLIISHLRPNGAVRVGWKPGATTNNDLFEIFFQRVVHQ